MARPWVAIGGDGLQIWRVTANVSNKQSRTADEGWYSSVGMEERLTTRHCKNPACYEMLHRVRAFANTVVNLRFQKKKRHGISWLAE
jgi:hypothetical protein